MWINTQFLERSLSVPAEEDLISDSHWLWVALERSVGWNGKRLRSSSWRRAWKRVAFLRRLSGRISEPSMANRGVEQWIASWVDPHVNQSHSPAVAVEKMIRDTCGLACSESLRNADPQLSFLKMYPDLFLSDSKNSSDGWKGQVIAWRQDFSRRQKWARRIGVYGSSFWPTPDGSVMQEGEQPATFLERQRKLKGTHQNGNGCGTPLAMAVQLWVTLTTKELETRTQERKDELLLPGQAISLMSSLHPPEMLPSGATSSETTGPSLRLNPVFAGWLMGWPRIIKDFSSYSVTELSHYKQLMRSALFILLSPSQPKKRIEFTPDDEWGDI